MKQLPLPNNLLLLLSHPNLDAVAVVERILRENSTDVAENLAALGPHFKIQVWFDQPVKLHTKKHSRTNDDGSTSYISYKVTDNHVFSFMWNTHTHGIAYRTGRGRGYPLLDAFEHIIKYEPVPYKETKDTFDSFEQFKARFDPLFISDSMIQRLWNETSAQTGKQYQRSDFRRICPEGQKIMERFLRFYKGPGTGSEDAVGYRKSYAFFQSGTQKPNAYLSEYHKSNGRGRAGRDISISHTAGNDIVHYSSEYPGCGNGRYGLIVNKTTFLHIEDD